MPERTIADAINDYLAPEQPDDCREASRAILVAALKASGPVAHRGRHVSLSPDGAVVVEDVPEVAVEATEPEPPAPEPVAATGPPRPAHEMSLPAPPAAS